ncbi:MAG TPA: HAMP domain-containing histidine kinase [Candidatus Ornithospirochaeta avicola]|uniref:histidine kinase n=1 Tax=Candidatus Ornithospirochaeta avicola TaxID=2840896 RepID=A0A9D1PUN4_9SPIO|nr:HAMP domain-containing histidine kinase [Candidatus Ornithospirochaeta avicola]
MIRNIYLRLLLPIMLIFILLFFGQLAFLVYATFNIQRDWKMNVFTSFGEEVRMNFDAKSYPISSSEFLSQIFDNIPSEVSGILIRDESGNVSVSIGSNTRGDGIPQVVIGYRNSMRSISTFSAPSSLPVSINTTSDVHDETIRVPVYKIEIDTHNEFSGSVVDSVSISDAGVISMSVSLPSVVSASDISGSFAIYSNGFFVAYMDIIAYDFDVYGPTEILINGIVKNLLLFFPFAILLTLVLGYLISKRNAKSIRYIQSQLNSLAEGNYEIKLDKRKLTTEEYEKIHEYILQLAGDLKRHQLSRKEWLKNISHDLNTPLTSLNMLISGAQDGLFKVDDALVEKMKEECNTLSERIKSVNFYANISEANYPVEKKMVNIFDLVDNVLQKRANVSFSSTSDFYVLCDFSLTVRALDEVLDNAYEYGDGNVSVFAQEYDEHCEIRVTNKGMLPSPRPQFFEPWARGDESRHSGGSGMGLPIAYQIMLLNGGSIQIDEKGGFVTVTLSFETAERQ